MCEMGWLWARGTGRPLWIRNEGLAEGGGKHKLLQGP